jgi:hypothetical protein
VQKDLNLNKFYFILFFCFCANLFSQTDTIYTLKKEKISCKIIEISDEEIQYTINGSSKKIETFELEKVVFKNGTTEKIKAKKPPFDLKNEKTRELIQANATVWGTKLLKCVFSKVSLNTTYIDWDQTYNELNNDSIINIALKTYYALPGFEDKEQIYWKVKTTTSLKQPAFYYIRSSDAMTTDATFLNCLHKLNRPKN